ncbi:MAG: DUF3108 domain-containing protein [Spirochaetota bacterium]
MNRKALAAVVLCLMLSTAGYVAAAHPFSAGEKLQYGILAAGFPVGKQTIELSGTGDFLGQPVYNLYGRSRTSGLLSIFYRLDDKWHVFMDRDSILPVRVEKDMKEGQKEGYYVYDIDQADRRVIIHNLKDNNIKTVQAENTVFDLFSLIYFYRKDPSVFDREFTFDFLEPNDVHTVHFRNEGLTEIKIDRISRYDEIPCIKLQQIGGVGIEIYVGSDELRLPLKLVVPSKLPRDRELIVEFVLEKYAPGEDQPDPPRLYRHILK